MNLPIPQAIWSRGWAVRLLQAVQLADERNHKRGGDVEIGDGRLILTSPNGTRYAVTVDNAGALSAVAV